MTQHDNLIIEVNYKGREVYACFYEAVDGEANKSLWPDARSVQTILDEALDLAADSDAFEDDEDQH